MCLYVYSCPCGDQWCWSWSSPSPRWGSCWRWAYAEAAWQRWPPSWRNRSPCGQMESKRGSHMFVTGRFQQTDVAEAQSEPSETSAERPPVRWRQVVAKLGEETPARQTYCKSLRNGSRNARLSIPVVLFLVFHCWRPNMASHIRTLCLNFCTSEKCRTHKFCDKQKTRLIVKLCSHHSDNVVKSWQDMRDDFREMISHIGTVVPPTRTVYSKGIKKSVDVWKTMEECWKWQCQHEP